MTHTATAIAKAGVLIAGAGRPVVLLHSSLSSKSQWRALIERMRGTHRLIAIDLSGYGETPLPAISEAFSLTDEVRLVERVLAETLEPGERFHLVGHSYGGAVALRLAYDLRQRVRSLSLFEPVAFHLLDGNDAGRIDAKTLAQALEAGFQRGDWLGAAARFVDYWSGPGSFSRLPTDKQIALSRTLAKVALDFRASFDEPLSAGDYRCIAMPTCLIGGLSSPCSTASVLGILTAVLPDHQLHWVAAGHMAPVTHPTLVNPIIEGFIHKVDALGVSFRPDRGWDADEDQARLYAAC